MSVCTTTEIQITETDQRILIHGSAAAISNRAVLFIGPSGSGKSALVLELMAAGAQLIADDRVRADVRRGTVELSAPAEIEGKIEARGMGILVATVAPPTTLSLVIDMGTPETDRLPPPRVIDVLGVQIPFFHKVESRHFAAAILRYLKSGSAI
jgi:HPr kinase/phosphorylase